MAIAKRVSLLNISVLLPKNRQNAQRFEAQNRKLRQLHLYQNSRHKVKDNAKPPSFVMWVDDAELMHLESISKRTICRMILTDFDTTYNHECIMDVATSLVVDAKTPITMEPRKTTLNNTAIDSKSTAVVSASASQNWLDALLAKLLAMWSTVVGSIAQNRSRTSQWSTETAGMAPTKGSNCVTS
jgi:hypothetical protein